MTEEPDPEDGLRLSTQAWRNAEQCEYEGHARACNPPDWSPRQQPASNYTQNDLRADWEPLLYEFAVDLYWSGHWHWYERFHGPLRWGRVIENGTHNPRGVIHAISGNGGPPNIQGCPSQAAGYRYHTCVEAPSYTRLIAHNATDLEWQQVRNNDSAVVDSWTIHQDHHGGPFPPPPPAPADPAGKYQWVFVHQTAEWSDLPTGAVQTGHSHSSEGGQPQLPCFVCRAPGTDHMGYGAEMDVAGSLSYADAVSRGGGGCRLDSGDTSDPYFIRQDFEVLVSVVAAASSSRGGSREVRSRWEGLGDGKQNASLPADLPPHAIQSGWSSLAARGRPTFVCRLRQGLSQTPGAGVSGSLSFADWPGVGHCRVVYNHTGHYAPSGYELLVSE